MELIKMHPPSRSGQPWTDDDYQLLIDLCRQGHGVDEIAERLRRQPNAARQRAKRMLPVEERGLPPTIAS